MNLKKTGVVFIALSTYALAGCRAAGPPPPLPGPSPFLDRIFLYLQYLFPLAVFLAVCSAIGFGVYLLITRDVSVSGKRGRETPFDIAGQRYARGELSRDEYIRIIKDLNFMDADKIGADEYENL